MEEISRYDKACDILKNTHDGDDLSDKELWLVQERVNDHLNDKGVAKFEEIYEKYKK